LQTSIANFFHRGLKAAVGQAASDSVSEQKLAMRATLDLCANMTLAVWRRMNLAGCTLHRHSASSVIVSTCRTSAVIAPLAAPARRH